MAIVTDLNCSFEGERVIEREREGGERERAVKSGEIMLVR
jgi:hypothetical protein